MESVSGAILAVTLIAGRIANALTAVFLSYPVGLMA